MQPPLTAEYAFDEDTRVTRVSDGGYTATLTDRWHALGGTPNGGYLLAVCLQALRGELPFPDPLVVSATYLRRPAPGPVQLASEIIRIGRRVGTGEVRLTQADKEIVRATATFTDLTAAEGPTQIDNAPPDLPDPEDAIDPMADASLPDVTIVDRFDFRYGTVPGWWRGQPEQDLTAEFWLRFRDGRPADPFTLPLMVDAAAPAVLDLPTFGSATIELTVHVRGRPAPGWVACRATTRHLRDGFHEEDFEIWDRDGQLVAQSRQLAVLP